MAVRGVRGDEAGARMERARAFRYRLIREAADPELSTKARGRRVRTVAAGDHIDPSGRLVRVSRHTLDHWIRVWQAGGFDALVPSPRQSSTRLPVEVIEMLRLRLVAEGFLCRIVVRSRQGTETSAYGDHTRG
jgi:putative transposase